jgi:hypothetical protein
MIVLCQTVARRELTALGYELAPQSLTNMVKVPLLLMGSGVELLGRVQRRWRWGGFAYLRNELLAYWSRLLNVQ